ncbi:MAG TPA: hypothetical protein VKE22_16185 [Haliangiales bacterium]|nr:hypothetical protein [Haliangiales bacterium]
MEHTPLDNLSEAARKATSGPAAMKMMAARGLAPLKPFDLACALYTLSLDPDEAIRQAADKSAREAPEKLVLGALADAALDARIIDYFAPRVATKAPLVEAILLNRTTADDTVVALVPRLVERDLELVAVNEQRLLRCPAIIGALYMNPKARMSTVDRCVELAVRNQVAVPGIPAWDQVVQAVLGLKGQPTHTPEEVDAAFAQVARVAVGEGKGEIVEVTEDTEDFETINEEEQKKVEEQKQNIPIEKLPIPAKIRLATIGNAFARAILVRDVNRMVALAAIRNPGVTDNEVLKFSSNRSLGDDVIREIATTKEWLKLYKVKVNLCNNPKTPLPVSMRLLPFMHERDLRNLGRSKGIPSALGAQARKLLQAKGRGG